MECVSVGICIHTYVQESKNTSKTTLDFYNSFPMKMQTMKNVKGLLMTQLKDFFLLDLETTMKGLAGPSEASERHGS